MRIIMIPTPDLAYQSGSGLFAVALAEYLAQSNLSIDVLCQKAPVSNCCSVDSGVRYHVLPLPLDHPVITDRPVLSTAMIDCVEQYVKRLSVMRTAEEVIVVHSFYGTFTALAGCFGQWFFGMPHVVSCFGRDVNVGAKQDERYRRLMRCVVRTADYVFASNAAIASTLRTDYSVEADRLSIIPCGIDTRCFSPHVSRRRLRDALRVSLDDLVCLTVQSSFGIDKGLEPLLRAIACTPLRRRGVVLLVVGHDDTPDQIHMRHLQSVSCELNLGDVVRFVGHKDHGEVADYLQAADVFIDPRLTGNFSSSTLEALYMGKCVIASDTEAARQLVSEGSNGLLVKPGDVDGMAATILACVESVDLRSRLEGAAVEWFAQSGGRYTYQEIARHVAQVYGEISCR